MKYIRLFEYVYLSDLEIGQVYKIQRLFVSPHMLDDEDRRKDPNKYKEIIEFAEIISLKPTMCRTYFLEDHKEYIMRLEQKYIKKLATPEECADFELIGNIKKYNL